ncbi:SRPBCC domain-containing protein [Phenylobacterium sp.]|uniref:SRPBCC domain-containing protein n=1 Tax=Phenylobacterium sp. TaxID=1871053 RepID=UPI00301D810E
MALRNAPDLMSGPLGRRGSMGPKTMSLKTEGKPPPPKGPSGVRVEHRIGVQAPAEVIWEVVHDLDRWAEWNPTYPSASGVIRIGETLDLTLALPDQPHQPLKPRVLEWVPNEQLHWRLTMMGGLIRTTRYIEIQALHEAGCIVDNGEIFGGLMGPSLGRRVRGLVRRGFMAMNEALKDRAETIWRARG